MKRERPLDGPWTIDELAEKGRWSRNHLYACVRRGEIAAVWTGKVIRIPDREARRLLGLIEPDAVEREEPAAA